MHYLRGFEPILSFSRTTRYIWQITNTDNRRLRLFIRIPAAVVLLWLAYGLLICLNLINGFLIFCLRLVGLSFRHSRLGHYARDVKYLVR